MFAKLRILILLFSISISAQNIPLTVGGFSAPEGFSEGIYQYDFNTKTGELSNQKLLVKTINPSFLALSSNKKFVFAVSKDGKEGSVISFKRNEDGTLEKISEQDSNGQNPCHVAINKEESKLVVSNYTGGNFSIYNIAKDGKIENAHQIVNLNQVQKPARAHSALFYKNDLFVADLGINTFNQYTFDSKKYQTKKKIDMLPNSGPRHFVGTKKHDYIYVINEYGSTVTTLKKEKDSYVRVSDISTLTDGFKDKNSCADIHLSKNEKFLYGSNRGENSIVVFKRNKKEGSLEKIQNISSNGNWPRNFTLDPSGKFLLVAHQKSNDICVFSIDKKTGMLSFLNKIDSPTPTCLQF